MARKIDSEEEYERRKALLEKHEREQSNELRERLVIGPAKDLVKHVVEGSRILERLGKKDVS